MARTAIKAAPSVEASNADEIIKPVAPDADIHNMVKTLAGTNNPDQLPGGAMTDIQLDDYVRPWLEQGFKVKTAQVIQAGDVNGIYTLQIYYCLVKE